MIIVLSTYPSKETAHSSARKIVESELAACVSIIKIHDSIYKWEGKIEENSEYLLIIKTTKKAYPQLEKFIKDKHPHDVPEVIYLEIKGGEKEYLQWVSSNTLSKLLRVPLDLSTMKRASDPPSKELKSAKNPNTLSR